MTKASGFTLIEMLIVIVVITITIGVSAPAFRTWIENEQFINSAESVRAVLQQAKMAAINGRCNVVVKFKDEGSFGTYHAFVDAEGGTLEVFDDGETEIIPETPITGNGRVDTLSFDGLQNDTTRFNSMGVAIGYAGSIVLKNEDLPTAYRRVVISVAGNIKMEKSADGTVWSL